MGSAQPASTLLDFAAARARLEDTSDALRAADLGVEDKRELEIASKRLRVPEVSADVRVFDVKKTLELPLGPLEPLAAQYGIDSPIVIEEESWRSRPILRATLSLYSGGAIPAQQELASAAVQQAEAERTLQSDNLQTQLVQAYFGQELAQRVVEARRNARDGMEQHLADTIQFERHGFATRAQHLQAEVARDQAEREFQRAGNDLEAASRSLALLLRTAAVQTSTPLFVIQDDIGTLEDFRRMAGEKHPQIDRFRAIVEQAHQGVRLQESKLKPQVFAFGQYDAHKEDATVDEPDWAVGIGLRYNFISGGRRQQIAAARRRSEASEAALDEVRVNLDISVTQAYSAMTNARMQFKLLDSTIAQASENLRLQTLSYREGQATSLDVIDARLALANAQVARAQAAYQFDVSLSKLLEASGQADEFQHYVSLPSKVIVQ